MSMSAEYSPGDSERTWDGQPVTKEPPFGATVVVYRWANGQPEFLVLHRGHAGADFEGDWAWGPPSGCRYPGEPVDHCALRELTEETGLRLLPHRVETESNDWYVYLAESLASPEIQLSAEHDRHLWLEAARAVARVSPEIVRAQLVTAARRLREGR